MRLPQFGCPGTFICAPNQPIMLKTNEEKINSTFFTLHVSLDKQEECCSVQSQILWFFPQITFVDKILIWHDFPYKHSCILLTKILKMIRLLYILSTPHHHNCKWEKNSLGRDACPSVLLQTMTLDIWCIFLPVFHCSTPFPLFRFYL